MSLKAELERLMRKMSSAQSLHERAQTQGEKEAAARAICRLAVRILEIQKLTDPTIKDYQYPDFGLTQK